MNWEAIGAVGEIIGAVAVVITLAYLAVQVRHSREATEANTKSLKAAARFESGRYWSEETIRMALSPDMAMIVAAGFEDASQLSDDDRERLIAWYLQHMLMKDALYQQHVDGVATEIALPIDGGPVAPGHLGEGAGERMRHLAQIEPPLKRHVADDLIELLFTVVVKAERERCIDV